MATYRRNQSKCIWTKSHNIEETVYHNVEKFLGMYQKGTKEKNIRESSEKDKETLQCLPKEIITPQVNIEIIKKRLEK